MAPRKKKVLTGVVDRPAAEEAFAQFATASAKSNQLTAKMDVEITRIRDKYQEQITKYGEEKESAFEKLLNYAENNRDEFGKKKSMDFTHGVLGFRTGTPKLKTEKGFTWAAVLKLLKEFMPEYVRTKEEPNKDKLLVDRNEPEVLDTLKKVGIYVDQDETFFVEPKQEYSEA